MNLMIAIAALAASNFAAPESPGATGAAAARAGEKLPVAYAQGDVADAMWREGRRAINDEEWNNAVSAFQRLRARYPKSAYFGDSYYWQAFALYQKGGRSSLREAVDLLDTQLKEHRSASMAKNGETQELQTRIRGMLAQSGDEAAAAAISKIAGDAASAGVAIGLNALREAAAELGRGAARAGRAATASSQSGRCRAEEDDERVMALNALLQMNSDDALPLLKQVLARRDTCSEILRRKAVFLVSQKRSTEAADILMATAQNDPDRETREQAVFWLSSVAGDRSVTLLEQILKTSTDESLQEKALFSLSQNSRGRGNEVLRDYAAREDVPTKLRENAIFWLGQGRATENGPFLRSLFGKVRSHELKDKIIFSLSQNRSVENNDFLLDQATNKANTMEIRKSSLFWASQSGAADVAKIAQLYDRADDQEFREQVIFVLSNKGRNTTAVDKLIDIAKNEKNRDLRSKAVFWLGQSRDPRAVKALQDIILKSPEQE